MEVPQDQTHWNLASVVTLARMNPSGCPMSLREDLKVFAEPGFYISAVLASLLIFGLLAFCGVMVHRVQL